MSKIGTWMGAAALALALAACDTTNITPGGACSAEGAKHTNTTGYTYTCKTDPGTGRRIWQQDAPLQKDRP